MVINPFDYTVIKFFNQFTQHSWAFDKIVGFFTSHNFYKGGLLTALLWWGWFKDPKDQRDDRRKIMAGLICSMIAVGAGKALSLAAPFRSRPLHTPELGLTFPYESGAPELEHCSSFPSDHAILLFGLAAIIFLVSRKAGIIAFMYTVLVNGFARVYVGLHYPTDILAGALMGLGGVLVGVPLLARTKPVQWIVEISFRKPHIFYPLFFILTYQVTDLFFAARATASGFKEFIEKVFL